ncbi:LysR family transcriptional regulator [Variovorax ureilyticus]|uniref:LysR family transcriptional regulator n=1 Tax=Variovorax ureilyticus TaxID=1836198 RepID=UPI003D669BF4
MDRFDAMSVLLAAVDTGSLSKASRKLGLPLATVSRKVADLEAHLKADLLIRSSRGLELTPSGRSYVAAARAILEQVSEAERTAAGEYTEPRGDLVITAPIMFGRMHALPVVTQFLATYPEVSAGLMLTDRVAHFLDDQVDVALRIGPLPDSRLVATRLGEVRHVVCASPAYLAAKGIPAEPAEIARHSVISFESVSAASAWTFQTNGKEAPVSFRSRFSVNTIDGAIDAGLAGAGLTRAVSYQVNEHVRAGRLQVVLQDFEPAARPVHLVYAQQSRLPLKLRAFVDFAVPRLREQLRAAAL